MHWKQEIALKKKKNEENKGFSFHAYFCSNLWVISIHANTYFCSKERKKNNVALWTQFYLWMLKMLTFFKARLWKGKAMKWNCPGGKVKYGSWTIQSTLKEVTRFAFRVCQTLSKSHMIPRINLVAEKLPASVCSQVSPQVFRLGGECFGRWWMEVVLKVGEMGVKRWILNWTDEKALDPC